MEEAKRRRNEYLAGVEGSDRNLANHTLIDIRDVALFVIESNQPSLASVALDTELIGE